MAIAGVVTIVGKNFNPTVIGTVKCSWGYDEGKSHTHKLEHILYLPDSPVNIISSTALDYHYDDDEGTYIKTKRH